MPQVTRLLVLKPSEIARHADKSGRVDTDYMPRLVAAFSKVSVAKVYGRGNIMKIRLPENEVATVRDALKGKCDMADGFTVRPDEKSPMYRIAAFARGRRGPR